MSRYRKLFAVPVLESSDMPERSYCFPTNQDPEPADPINGREVVAITECDPPYTGRQIKVWADTVTEGVAW